MVTCVPTGVNHGERFVHIGGKGQPQGLNVLMQDGPRGASGHLAYWLERCSEGRDLGLSQEGERILLAQCQNIGLDRVVLVTDGDCGVQRLVALGRP